MSGPIMCGQSDFLTLAPLRSGGVWRVGLRAPLPSGQQLFTSCLTIKCAALISMATPEEPPIPTPVPILVGTPISLITLNPQPSTHNPQPSTLNPGAHQRGRQGAGPGEHLPQIRKGLQAPTLFVTRFDILVPSRFIRPVVRADSLPHCGYAALQCASKLSLNQSRPFLVHSKQIQPLSIALLQSVRRNPTHTVHNWAHLVV